MTLDIYKSVISACPLLLRPVIRILLRAGITYKQFASIAKNIFVEVACDEYGINGRKTNTSRVAILTGISRSEVTKVRKKLDECGEIEIPTTVSNAGRLLSGWHLDREFLDKEGNPLALTIDGPEPSFTTLMNKYGGDIPLTAMLKELKSVSAVETHEDKRIYPLKRFFMPINYDENRIFSLVDDFVDLGKTSYHNFVRGYDDESRLQVKVTNDYVDINALPEFKAMVNERGHAFLEELDEWLSTKEVQNPESSNKTSVKIGLGLYLIQDD